MIRAINMDKFIKNTNFCAESDDADYEPNRYQILSPSQVERMMNNEIAKVQIVVNLPKIEIRQLLNRHKWDVDVFLENFYDGRVGRSTVEMKSEENTPVIVESKPSLPISKAFSEPIVTRSVTRKRLLESQAATSSSILPQQYRKNSRCARVQRQSSIICEICLEDIDSHEDIIKISCKNVFCKECFLGYIISSIEGTSSIQAIMCPGFRCKIEITDETIIELLSPCMRSTYQRLITNGFVQCNRLIRWCPSPDCSKAIKVLMVKQPAVRCACGASFCFQCLQEAHDLIPCELFAEFLNVRATNLEVASWLVKHTKPCPECKANIEKNGGCNHMSCTMCGFQFCWLCFAPWNTHRFCKTTESAAYKSSDLCRLVDCNTKYQTMHQSLKLDENMYKTTLARQELLSKDQWFKIEFVKEAVEVLLRCRRTLMDTFIFTYFMMNDDIQWMRFEMYQIDLQTATEDLSHVLETQVSYDNYHTMKRHINDKITYCKGLHRALFDHVKDGFQHDWWKRFQ